MKSRENYELKTDRLAFKTGNAFVEFESRKKESGIITSKAGIWIFKIVDKKDKHLFSIEIPNASKLEMLKCCFNVSRYIRKKPV